MCCSGGLAKSSNKTANLIIVERLCSNNKTKIKYLYYAFFPNPSPPPSPSSSAYTRFKCCFFSLLYICYTGALLGNVCAVEFLNIIFFSFFVAF